MFGALQKRVSLLDLEKCVDTAENGLPKFGLSPSCLRQTTPRPPLRQTNSRGCAKASSRTARAVLGAWPAPQRPKMLQASGPGASSLSSLSRARRSAGSMWNNIQLNSALEVLETSPAVPPNDRRSHPWINSSSQKKVCAQRELSRCF